MLESSQVRVPRDGGGGDGGGGPGGGPALNSRSSHMSLRLLLLHAEKVVEENLSSMEGSDSSSSSTTSSSSSKHHNNSLVYPLACVQLLLENAMKNSKMPTWWVESYRPVAPPKPPEFVDEYGRLTNLVPVVPAGYSLVLGAPIAWRTSIGGHFATAPRMLPLIKEHEDTGIHGVCSLLESPTVPLCMSRGLALRRALRECRGDVSLYDQKRVSMNVTSSLRRCLVEAREENVPTRVQKRYPAEIIPPLEIFLLDRPPPNTRAKWEVRDEPMHLKGTHRPRYVEGLKFSKEVLEC